MFAPRRLHTCDGMTSVARDRVDFTVAGRDLDKARPCGLKADASKRIDELRGARLTFSETTTSVDRFAVESRQKEGRPSEEDRPDLRLMTVDLRLRSQNRTFAPI